MPIEAPVSRWKETVRPEWADYNGHMNVAYFTLIFDHATDVFYPLVGLGKSPTVNVRVSRRLRWNATSVISKK